MKKDESKGFTIVEVSLVIAIAGLIFLMVFIAVSQLQRQQRDSRRRDDILSFLEAVKKYQTNNRGMLPETSMDWKSIKESYLGDSFVDPDGTEYDLWVSACHKNGYNAKEGEKCSWMYPELESMDHKLYIYRQATCKGEEAVWTSNPRNIAVLYRLEGAGVYCANT